MQKALKAKKSTEQIIAEIHNEFDSASEKLLQEAKEIIIDSNKGDRLARLGFASAKPVKDVRDLRDAQQKNNQLAERVSYFKQWYPHNKFITEESVLKICEKYELSFGDVQYYKGDVPEKNLVEMEKFVLRKEDMEKDITADFVGYFSRKARQSLMGIDWGSGLIDTKSWPMSQFSPSEPNEDRYTKPSFKICAPEKDFDTSRLTKKGHMLELNIPDPIVLQPVKGGYLIVTKWGLEAGDDMVKNEIAN